MDQRTKPGEIIVVDDGGLAQPPFKEACTRAGIPYIYHKKDRPGLTESRNAGISLATGDVVFFFDDDVVLLPNYIQEILKVYEDDQQGEVGGVAGAIANPRAMTFARRLRRVFDVFFLVSGFKEGKVLPSGFCTSFGTTASPIKRVCEVDFFPGCGCSFRKEVFEKLRFTEKYPSHESYGEDKDFSYQVSKEYKLLFTPEAKLNHHGSLKMRPDKEAFGRMFVLGNYFFFTMHVKKHWWGWIFFWHAVFGYSLSRLVIMLLSFDKSEVLRIRGILGAVKDILTGRAANQRPTRD